MVGKHLRGGHHVWTAEVVSHDLDAEVAPSLYHDLDRFLMSPGHHHNMGGSRFRHDFSF